MENTDRMAARYRQGAECFRCLFSRKTHNGIDKCRVFVTMPFGIASSTGRGAVWLACLLWEQEVGGSNPLAPNVKKP